MFKYYSDFNENILKDIKELYVNYGGWIYIGVDTHKNKTYSCDNYDIIKRLNSLIDKAEQDLKKNIYYKIIDDVLVIEVDSIKK